MSPGRGNAVLLAMGLGCAHAPDSTSEIPGLAVYRSETRPIVVKVGEAADAAR